MIIKSKIIARICFMMAFQIGIAASVFAQGDDIYYDPESYRAEHFRGSSVISYPNSSAESETISDVNNVDVNGFFGPEYSKKKDNVSARRWRERTDSRPPTQIIITGGKDSYLGTAAVIGNAVSNIAGAIGSRRDIESQSTSSSSASNMEPASNLEKQQHLVNQAMQNCTALRNTPQYRNCIEMTLKKSSQQK